MKPDENKLPNLLPKELIKCLKKDEKNFKIIRFLKLGDDRSCVEVEFHIPAFEILHKKVLIPMNMVRKKTLADFIPDCFTIQGKSSQEQLSWIREQILSALDGAKPERLLTQGYHFLESNGAWLYVMGDEIVSSDKAYDFRAVKFCPHNPQNIKVGKRNCNSSSIYEWIKVFCEQGEDKIVLLLGALTPLLRPIFHELGMKALRPVNIMYVGPSGSGKSSFSSLVTSYGKCSFSQGVNLSSDKQFILKQLANYIDRACLIDDLNNSSAEREMKKKVTHLSEILQMTCSEGSIGIGEQEIDLSRVALIITSEVLLAHSSAINRSILVRGASVFNSTKLSWLQENECLFTDWVYAFSKFICSNQDRLSGEVKNHLMNGDFEYKGWQEDSAVYVGYPRIMSNHRSLGIMSYLLTVFLSEMSVFEHDRERLHFDESLKCAVKTAVSNTLDAVKRTSDISDVMRAFLGIFKCDVDKIYANAGLAIFVDKPKLLFREKNIIYFQAESLASYISSVIGRTVSDQILSQELMKSKLLLSHCGGFSRRLPGEMKPPKKLKNTRFHMVDVLALIDLVKSVFPGMFDLYDSPIPELRPKAYR